MSTQLRAVELLLDASDSMNKDFGGGTRIEIAKRVLRDVVTKDLKDGTQVALRVFGARGGCDTELVVPLAPLDRERLQNAIAATKAKGSTNIAGSLDAVKDDLAAATGQRHVVLVTDGKETCKGDVEAALDRLKGLGIDVQLDIVGIAPDRNLQGTLERYAERCGGAYLAAHDTDKLHEALQGMFTAKKTVHAAKVALQFSAIDDKVTIYLNKREVWSHGYAEHNPGCDLSDKLQKGTNTLKVVAYNGKRNAALEGKLLADGEEVATWNIRKQPKPEEQNFVDDTFLIVVPESATA